MTRITGGCPLHSRAEGPSSLGMSVQFGDYDRGYVYFVLEGLGLGLTSLSYSSIHHKHNVLWILKGQVKTSTD